jgi:uncharacterized membrane protein YdjX (TVP38/TMEM64 family)
MPDETDWRQLVRRLGPAGPWALVSAILPGVMGMLLVTLFLKDAGDWFKGHGNLGLAAYVVAFALSSGLAILPTYAQAVLGGYAFGFALGYPAALVGFTLGSMVGYEVGRLVSGDRATRIINEHPKWQAVCDALVHSGFWKTLLIVSLLRAPPNSPFALTNLALSATRTPRVIAALAAMIGMAPRTIAYVFIGVSMGQEMGEGIPKPLWMKIVGIASGIVVLIIISMIGNRAIAQVTKNSSPDDPNEPSAEPSTDASPESSTSPSD